MSDWPVLQVALDLDNLHRAIQIAREAVKGGAQWLEAGTPLIKSEGLEALRALRREFPDQTLVADLKTMDVGGVEVEMATKAGADIVTVLGLADDGTFLEAVKAGRQYGSRVMADLINVPDKVARARELEALGIEYLNLHIGIDTQMKGGASLDELSAMTEATALPVSVAGGLNSVTAPQAVRKGAAIIVVGGAITKAHDVTRATQTILETLETLEAADTELFVRYGQEQLRTAFEKVSSSNVSDAMHRAGGMVGIEPRVAPNTRICGPAVTVRTLDGDWAKPVEAIDIAGAGEVLVMDVDGGTTAIWGELASCSCKVKGIVGVVIDGAARDIQGIKAMGFPLWSRHASPHAGEPKGYGEINCEIVCGGQTVRRGDWIIADESGVTAVPREQAVEVANRALDVKEKENRLREEIKQGSTLAERLDLLRWEKVG